MRTLQIELVHTYDCTQAVSLSFIKVLKVKSTAQAEEVLRVSQKLLHKGLHTLNTEYVNTVRHLGEAAKSSRILALRTALQSLDDLHTEFRDSIIGSRFPHLPLMSSSLTRVSLKRSWNLS